MFQTIFCDRKGGFLRHCWIFFPPFFHEVNKFITGKNTTLLDNTVVVVALLCSVTYNNQSYAAYTCLNITLLVLSCVFDLGHWLWSLGGALNQ